MSETAQIIVLRPCARCGKATGAGCQAWICDPGEEPINVWLHRDCEVAFLEHLDEIKQQGALPPRKAALR
jgi:hypothetical protein